VPEMMNLGDLSRRLGVGISQELLASIGIEHVEKHKRAFLYTEEQWPDICKTLAGHIRSRVDAELPEKPPSKPRKAAVQPAAPTITDEDDEL
jgi:hypothetical protein